MSLLRRGRFKEERVGEVAEYTTSLEWDKRIFYQDLLVDKAHVVMLIERKIISPENGAKILDGLNKIEEMGLEGLELDPELEDIHIVIESKLVSMLGEEVGGRMHTARSRNDEVVTCLRISLREELLELMNELVKLRETLLSLAEQHINTITIGMTHLQHAQPVTLAHHLLAHTDPLERDLNRLEETYKRVNMSPLGAGALATTGFPIDREKTASLMGFDGLVENSMDAVSTRDFILETVTNLSILMANLSRLVEELILWSTFEFGFVEIDDKYSSTSSIMPQKKNPDSMELARAKVGRVYGNLTTILTILKAAPLSYVRDLQEVSPHLWDSIDTTRSTIRIVDGVVSTIKVNKEEMKRKAEANFAIATELADTLVREADLPFRTAHMIVSKIVSNAISNGLKPSEITPDSVISMCKEITGKEILIDDSKLLDAIDVTKNVEVRSVVGGPAPEEVNRMILERKKRIESEKSRIENKQSKLEKSLAKLEKIVSKCIKKYL